MAFSVVAFELLAGEGTQKPCVPDHALSRSQLALRMEGTCLSVPEGLGASVGTGAEPSQGPLAKQR